MSHRFSTLQCVYYRSKRRHAPMEVRPRGGEPPSSPRNCRSNGLENFWVDLVSHREPCKLHQRAVLHAASKRDAESPAVKRLEKKDAFKSRHEAASAITGSK
ncbi:hypothetical protein TcCL_ESM11270 [Trypanosoma cruzi]|nr:hypothetical protein TcCL_ESM11270 [Trypanosoma cruzi]